MKTLDLPIGSKEWLDYRRGKIGSSDASVIMGTNPWKTPYKLWKQHIEGTQDAVNPAMKRGLELEPIARDMFIRETGIAMTPNIVVNEDREWQFATLDGLSDHGDIIVEIKCGNNSLHEMAMKGVIPPYYFCQIQHQIAVCKPKKAYYCSFNGQEIKILEVTPDEKFAEDLITKEEKFWKLLTAKEAPPLTDSDYEIVEHARGSQLLQEYMELAEQEKAIKQRRDDLKNELIGLGPQRNFMINSTKIYQAQNTSYDFNLMREAGIDLDRYKKLSKPYWVIAMARSGIRYREES